MKLVRSARAPDTMVAEVPAKASWKTKWTQGPRGCPPAGSPARAQKSVPAQPFQVWPNITAHPKKK
jgi:hypothetical protein